MFGDLDKYLAVFLTGFCVTYLLTPLARSVARRWGIVDIPDERRPHQQPTPRGGGIAVVIGAHAACLVALALPWARYARSLDLVWWEHFAGASLVLLIVGVVDDIRGVRPWLKLIGQAAAATLIFASGTRISSVAGVELPGAVSYALTLLWLIAIINAFNLIDGLDGLACGLAIISALGLCGMFVLMRTPGDALVLLGLMGACLAFLRFNFHPASVFLGDTGSMFLGFMLGTISLQTLSQSTFILAMATPMFVLGVPIFDTLLAVWRRSARRWLFGRTPAGESPKHGIMLADLEHLHHRLLKAGLNARRVATLLWIANGLLVACGLLITSFQSHAVGIFLTTLVVALYVTLRHVAVVELLDTGRAVLRGFRRPTQTALKALVYPVWDVAWMAAVLAASIQMVPGGDGRAWERWLLGLPIWIAPTFTLLALCRTYQIVWSRARARDALAVALCLWGGLVISSTIVILVNPAEMIQTLLRAAIFGGLSHPAIVSVRLIYRFAEEFVPLLIGRHAGKGSGERILLYGAGGRCQLFLKERNFLDSSSADEREIVGLIDDDPSLRLRRVYGYQVLGGQSDLPELVKKHDVRGIIITAILSLESEIAVRRFARAHRVRLSEWRFEEKNLDIGPTPVPPDAGDDQERLAAAPDNVFAESD
jgi:UDP-GlcNAc:undecaprenyl-phosphate GlcNAc-1-phosphate transferase